MDARQICAATSARRPHRQGACSSPSVIAASSWIVHDSGLAMQSARAPRTRTRHRKCYFVVASARHKQLAQEAADMHLSLFARVDHGSDDGGEAPAAASVPTATVDHLALGR